MGLRTQSRLFWFIRLLRHKCEKFIACHILMFTNFSKLSYWIPNRFSLFYMPGCFSMALKQYVPRSVTTEWHWRLFHSRLRGFVARKPWHLAQIPFVTSLHTADRWMIKRTNERMDGGIFPAPVYFDMPTMMPFCLGCDHSLRVCTETDLSVIVYPIVHSTLPIEFSWHFLYIYDSKATLDFECCSSGKHLQSNSRSRNPGRERSMCSLC